MTLQPAAAQRADRRNADYPTFASLFKCSKYSVATHVNAGNPRTLVLMTSSSNFQSSSGLRCPTPAYSCPCAKSFAFFVGVLPNYTVDEDARLEL